MKKILCAFVLILLVITNICYAANMPKSLDYLYDTQDQKKVIDEIITAMMSLPIGKNNARLLKSVNEYQVVFEQEAGDQNGLAFLLKDFRTAKNPVLRTIFNCHQYMDKIRAQCVYELVMHPYTNNEFSSGLGANNTQYNDTINFVLQYVGQRINRGYTKSIAEFYEEMRQAPSLGIFALPDGTITQVVKKSLAEKAKLKKNDIIIEVNDQKVELNLPQLLIDNKKNGEILKLRVRRKSREWNVKIQL